MNSNSVICHIVGARPNFMKAAPVIEALNTRGATQILVHTGQHYDANMSQVFFDQLNLPQPDIYLGVGSGTHAQQTARIMQLFEPICTSHQPTWVVVYGDVNSTVAAALVASKLGIPVVHVEAGLRSNDRSMPEELNRIVTDHLADLLLVTEQSGIDNLRHEGIEGDRVKLVGNCMVDTLLKHAERAREAAPWQYYGLTPGQYALVTLHRPSNVDNADELSRLLANLVEVVRGLPLLFPVHPRTEAKLRTLNAPLPDGIHLTEPMDYLTFVGLMACAKFVLTDSGGVQEETTALAVPCLTLRENTERPITVTHGSNRLVGRDPEAIKDAIREIFDGQWRIPERPPFWDGHAGDRIAEILYP